MGIKETLTKVLAGTVLTIGAGFAGGALAQEIVKPEILKQTPVEEKQECWKKEYEKKQEKKEEREKLKEFDDDELCGETQTPDNYLKAGQLRLNAFNSKDLDRLDASAKLVFAGGNSGGNSRFNLYSLVSDIVSKGGEGAEDLNTTFQRHGLGFGKYINLDQAVLYPEPQAFYERADHESEPTGKVNLKRDNLLLGGKLGYSRKDTGTKVLGQALFGKGHAEGQVSETKPYDEDIARMRLGLTFMQRLTPHIQESEDGLSLRLDALFDKTNYKKLQNDQILSLRLGMPYVVRFNDKSLVVEPFLAWRKEQTSYNGGRDVRKDYFGGGLAFKYRVGNFELCFIPGYDEEHGWNTNIGLIWYFGAGKNKR